MGIQHHSITFRNRFASWLGDAVNEDIAKGLIAEGLIEDSRQIIEKQQLMMLNHSSDNQNQNDKEWSIP